MAERKSLAEAMTMSPEKLAFIKQGTVGLVQPTHPEPKAQPDSPPMAIEPEIAGTGAEQAIETGIKTAKPQSRARASRRDEPNANEILDQLLVPVTIRLQHRTSQALRRAYLEQRLKHAKPDTQQEIVEMAIVEWLSKHGFLERP
jgi:hypothetical protein